MTEKESTETKKPLRFIDVVKAIGKFVLFLIDAIAIGLSFWIMIFVSMDTFISMVDAGNIAKPFGYLPFLLVPIYWTVKAIIAVIKKGF